MIDQAQKEQFGSALTSAKRILITLPLNPSVDDFAAALSLGLVLEASDKRPTVFSSQDVRVEQAQLFGIEKVTKSLGPRNFVIAIDNAVDTVERVDYFLDKGTLNIVLPPIDPQHEVKSEQVHFDYSNTKYDLIISLRQPKDEVLGKNVIQEQSLYSNTPTVVISNQIGRFRTEEINIVNQTALSLSEIVVELLAGLKLPVNGDIAYNLFQGISRSTRNFSVNNSSPAALEAAAWCLKAGASKTSFAPAQPHQNQAQKPAQEAPKSNNAPKEDWIAPKIYKGSSV